MKTYRMRTLFFVCISMYMLATFQFGCAVGPSSDAIEKHQKHLTLLNSLFSQKDPHTALIQEPFQVSLGHTMSMSDVLNPIGTWTGYVQHVRLNKPQSQKTEIRIQIRKKGILKTTQASSASWSLFKTAHACGPYGTSMSLTVGGTIQIAGYTHHFSTHQGILPAEGQVSSFSAFVRNARIRLVTQDGLHLSAYLKRDKKSQKEHLVGNLYRIVKKRSVQLGRLTLQRGQNRH